MWQRTTWPSKAEKFAKYQAMAHPPESWLDFDTFFADMGECPLGHTLDRVDTRIGYSKDNCRWATRAEQIYNREYTVKYTDGTLVLDETALSNRLGLPRSTVRRNRTKLGKLPEGWKLLTYAEALELTKLQSKP